MSEPELKPCPFDNGCQDDLVEIVADVDDLGRPMIFTAYVHCSDCGARGPQEWAEGMNAVASLAARSWNGRSGQ